MWINTYDHTEQEIQNEFLFQNQWITGTDLIYIFPSMNILKIQFTNTISTKMATDNGIFGFNMSIPEHNIKTEDYVPINTCMRCNQTEVHYTKECKKDEAYGLCSECASPDHTWRECKSEAKKCINCGGNRKTLAFKCPEKR